jgi:hypothetical protein
MEGETASGTTVAILMASTHAQKPCWIAHPIDGKSGGVDVPGV